MSGFHPGEIAVQEALGERGSADLNGRILFDRIPAGALSWLARQPFAVFSGLDSEGRLWATMAGGSPGFARALGDGSALELDLPPLPDDPVFGVPGERLGALFLEPLARRRLRVNGRVAGERPLVLEVDLAYPNCPKFLRRRRVEPAEGRGDQDGGISLPEWARILVSGADTFFVGSTDDAGNLDASHRGGDPGFVQVLDSSTLRIPDYPGNSMFNTLGNLHVDPRAGLLFAEGTRQVHLTGRAVLDLPSRTWTFTVDRWLSTPLPVRWGSSEE